MNKCESCKFCKEYKIHKRMSDIDGIKAEIKTEISDYEGCADFNEGIRFGLRTALEIIDKHIDGLRHTLGIIDKYKADLDSQENDME